MKAVLVYATREGQTRRIAEHVAVALRSHGVKVDLHDVRSPQLSIDWPQYGWACVAASVHVGHHEPEMIAFVKAHRQELQRLRGAFLSVTLSAAGAPRMPAHRGSAATRRPPMPAG